MKKPIKLILLFGVCVLAGACENNRSSEVIPQVKQNVSFQLDIQTDTYFEMCGLSQPIKQHPARLARRPCICISYKSRPGKYDARQRR